MTMTDAASWASSSTCPTMASEVDEPVRYVIRGCTGRPGRSRTSIVTTEPAADQVADPGEVVGAAPEQGAALHDEIRLHLADDLLIDPQVEGVLADRHAHEVRVAPGPAEPSVLVVEVVEAVGDERPVQVRTRRAGA